MQNDSCFYDLAEKICNIYDIDSIYQSGTTIRGFINQVHEATHGDVDKLSLLSWIEKHGVEYVFEKVIYIFSQGKPYGGYLCKAIKENWQWNPSNYLDEPKKSLEQRLNIDEPIRLGATNIITELKGG